MRRHPLSEMSVIELSPSTPSASGSAALPAMAPAGLLAEITAGLASGNDLNELLARFLSPVVTLAGAAAGAVRVLDDAGQRMHLVASQGLPEPVLEAERAVEGDCGANIVHGLEGRRAPHCQSGGLDDRAG